MQLLISMPGGSDWLLIGLIVFIPVIALIDILRSQFVSSNDKLLWALVVLMLPFIGSILYFAMGRGSKLR